MLEKFKKKLPLLLISFSLVLMLAGHAARLWNLPVISVLDNYFYDVRVRLFMPNTIDDRIVIVDIDEQSLAEVGRWPWGRNRVAQLLATLTDKYDAAVVGFDIVFAEPDQSSNLATFEELARKELQADRAYQNVLSKLRSQLDYDQIFADTLQGRPVVLGYYFSNHANAEHAGVLPDPTFTKGHFADYPDQFLAWRGYGGNLPLFQQVAGAGHFNPMVDFDGSTRRIPLLVEYYGNYFEALSLAIVRTLLGGATLVAQPPSPGVPIESIGISTPLEVIHIPVDGDAAALVPYRGLERSFRYVSAADVLAQRLPPDTFTGRIVLVGTTAPGLNDLRTTPVGSSYPGVEIQASMIAGILGADVKEKPNYILAVDLLSVLFAGAFLTVFLPLLSPLKGGLFAAALLAASLGFNLMMWQAGNTVLPFASVALTILAIYVINTAWGFFSETRIKRQVTALFGQYVPPELVQEMAKNPSSYSMEGRNAELTVLFSDIRSFTTISESLDPQDLTHLMNEYLGCMTAIIQQRRGTLDKYIGDAIMAFWGAPLSDSQHARNAVITALEMQKALRQLDQSFEQRGWPILQIGIGINTGVMAVVVTASQMEAC